VAGRSAVEAAVADRSAVEVAAEDRLVEEVAEEDRSAAEVAEADRSAVGAGLRAVRSAAGGPLARLFGLVAVYAVDADAEHSSSSQLSS